MAFIQVSLMSKSLMRTVPVNVILPTDKLNPDGSFPAKEKKYKTLYLLHGVIGSSVDWVNGTRIQRWAEEKGLCVVMPSGENMFYLDHPESNNNYGEFIGKELPEQMQRMFPLSDRREDNFIGGLSMGGYGALRNGLKYSENFGTIVALSAALILYRNLEKTNDESNFLARRDYAEACFGDLEESLKNDRNPEVLVRELKKAGKTVPMIYLACGDKDGLLPDNERFAALLDEEKVPYVFEVGPGAHEWDFWDTYICKAVKEWLPLDDASQGISSGNVQNR